jgi:hypothetical protein
MSSPNASVLGAVPEFNAPSPKLQTRVYQLSSVAQDRFVLLPIPEHDRKIPRHSAQRNAHRGRLAAWHRILGHGLHRSYGTGTAECCDCVTRRRVGRGLWQETECS